MSRERKRAKNIRVTTVGHHAAIIIQNELIWYIYNLI